MRKQIVFLCFILFSNLYVHIVVYATDLGPDPEYTITLSMPQRRIIGAKEINVSISVSGLGSIDYGSIGVQSDSDNILMNTFWIKQYVTGRPQLEEGIKIGPAEKTRTLSNNAIMSIMPVNLTEGLQHGIIGNFQITTKDMSPGKYRLKMVFFVQNQGKNYSFEDSIEYTINTFFSQYFPELVSMGLSIVSSAIFLEYRLRREQKKKKERSRKPRGR